MLLECVASPTYKRHVIFKENLVGIESFKKVVILNKPIYVGLSVLDTSKILMYNFHYNHINQIYGDAARLLFTDTDSLCYHIKTNDVYEDMAKHEDLYDFSDYPANHPLFSLKNKKVIGKFKDESLSIPIIEFVSKKNLLLFRHV
jgi:hypothetical protein